MLAEKRHAEICEFVSVNKFVSLKELSEAFNISESTARRDIDYLHSKGKLIRSRGGAIAITDDQTITPDKELAVEKRIDIGKAAKIEICKYAAHMIHDGDFIFIDGGSTLTMLADFIKGLRINIITNNVLFARRMADSNSSIFLLGGNYVPKYDMTLGSIAVETLSKFNLDYAFIGAIGIDSLNDIVYTAELETVAVKIAAIQNSRKSCLLVDSSKFSVKGYYKFINASRFDHVITEKSETNIEYGPNVVVV